MVPDLVFKTTNSKSAIIVIKVSFTHSPEYGYQNIFILSIYPGIWWTLDSKFRGTCQKLSEFVVSLTTKWGSSRELNKICSCCLSFTSCRKVRCVKWSTAGGKSCVDFLLAVWEGWVEMCKENWERFSFRVSKLKKNWKQDSFLFQNSHLLLYWMMLPAFRMHHSLLVPSTQKGSHTFTQTPKMQNMWKSVASPFSMVGYQWKDNIHIFHLVPSSALCDHQFGHKNLLKSRTEVIITKMFISVHVLTMKGSMVICT